MFSKLQDSFLGDNVVNDNMIVIDDSQDTSVHAYTLKFIVEADVQTTTTPMYILVVYGD